MAKHAHTTPAITTRRTRPRPAAAPANRLPATILAPLPSIYDLGCARAAISAEFARLDDAGEQHETTLELLGKQEAALDELIATRPAMTLADAAVQVGVACTLVNVLAASDWRDAPERLQELHDNMERMLLSALPFVAAASGLDVAAMCWQEHLTLRAAYFGLAEVVA